jgi:peptide/nickel transport system permease protein
MKLFLHKSGYILLMLFLITVISFMAIHAAPNSFLSGGELNPNMSAESIAQLKKVYGLDKPLLEQYRDWIINMLQLNFGISFVSGQDVTAEIMKRLPITLSINIISMLFVFFISIWLGIKAAVRYEERTDMAIRQLSLVSFAMPSFYLALLMILLFSVKLGWFPITGLHSIGGPDTGFAYVADMAWHLFLPICVMVFLALGSMTVYVRSLTLEILKSDY